MHLLASAPGDVTLEKMTDARRRPGVASKLRASVLAVAARLLNYRRFTGSWHVDLAGLEAGDVGVTLSALYQPFAEMDLGEPYGAPPEASYYPELVALLDAVEAELRALDPGGTRHAIVKRAADLDSALQDGRVAFLHCVEGGFHLGATPEEVPRRDQRARDPVPRRPALQRGLPAAARGAHGPRRGGRARDVRAPRDR